MAREQLKNLTEPMYYVLLSLLKDNHGYGIMQMVEELTEGRMTIGAGTLYSLLSRYEKEEIIVQVVEENRRKIYHITEKGSKVLWDEYNRLNHLVEDGRKFFEFEGERKDPPDTGDSDESEEKETAKSKTAGIAQDVKQEEKKSRKEKRRLPQGGWNYGGAY